MARKTLLKMTQDILSAMNSDNVNNIQDTEESTMVAQHIRDTYDYLITSREWPFLSKLSALTSLGDTATPTKLEIPTNVEKIYWFKYNKEYVVWKDPTDFHDLIVSRDTTASNVDGNGYRTDKDPSYFTSYDDQYIFCDSYDSDDETTLQSINSVIYCTELPSWSHTDEYLPDLPDKFYTLLYQEALSVCFLNVKQQGNIKAESNAKNSKARMQSNSTKFSVKKPNTFGNNYGRK